MIIPYKAMPNVPGAVIRFKELFGYVPMARRDIALSAFALLNTNLAVEALGYETMPSVLIMTSEGYSMEMDSEIRSVSDMYVRREGDRSVREIVSNEFTHRIYGLKGSKSPGKTVAGVGEGPPDSPFSDHDFLKGVVVHEPTGIHVYHIPNSLRFAAQVKRAQMAQKYFDIVLVDYSILDRLDQENSVTVLEYLVPRKDPSNSRFVPVRVYHDLVAGMKKKTWGKDAFSIQNTYRNKNLGLLMASSILLAALAPGKSDQHLWSELSKVKPTFNDKFSSAAATSGDKGVQAVLAGGGMLSLLGAAVIAFASFLAIEPEMLQFAAYPAVFGLVNGGFAGTLAIGERPAAKAAAKYGKRFIEQNSHVAASNSNELLPPSANPVLLTAGVGSKSAENLLTYNKSDTPSSAPDNAQESQHDSPAAPEVVRKVLDTPPLSKVVLSKRLGKLTDKWMTYELDPMKSLDYPLMLDASCPQTRRFLNAMNHATSLEEELSSGEVSVVDFQQAVMDAEDAFFEAEGHAKKMRYAHLDAGQKKKIRDARPLVALLDDEDASPHEKVSAYRKAGDFLEGIIALPERPIMGLLETSQV